MMMFQPEKQPETQSETIVVVLSIDWDRCLMSYPKAKTREDFIARNARLAKYSIEEVEKIQKMHPGAKIKVVGMLGSNRQTIDMELLNTSHNATQTTFGVAEMALYPASYNINQFLEHTFKDMSGISYEFDYAMLEDWNEGEFGSGATYCALEKIYNEIRKKMEFVTDPDDQKLKLQGIIWEIGKTLKSPETQDESEEFYYKREYMNNSKGDLIYLQIQHIVNKHKDDQVYYLFTDDLERSVLKQINSFRPRTEAVEEGAITPLDYIPHNVHMKAVHHEAALEPHDQRKIEKESGKSSEEAIEAAIQEHQETSLKKAFDAPWIIGAGEAFEYYNDIRFRETLNGYCDSSSLPDSLRFIREQLADNDDDTFLEDRARFIEVFPKRHAVEMEGQQKPSGPVVGMKRG